MWKIFAIVVLSMNGSPMGEPHKLTNTVKFASEAECKSFEASDKNKAAIENLKETLAARLQPGIDVIVGTTCELAGDDGSI